MSKTPIKTFSTQKWKKKSPIHADEQLSLWILPDSQNPISIPCSLIKGETISSDGTWVKLVSSSQQFFFRTNKSFNFCGQNFYVGRRPPKQFKRVFTGSALILLTIAAIASAFPISRAFDAVSFLSPPAIPSDTKTIEHNSNIVISEPRGAKRIEKREATLPVLNRSLKGNEASSDSNSAIDPMRCSPIPKVSSQGANLGSVEHSKQQEENWFVCR